MLKVSTKIFSTSIAVLGISTSMLSSAEPTINQSISAAIDDSNVDLNLRYRYELVDQDGKPEDAGASTLRSRVTLTSGNLGHFKGLVEIDNVSYLGGDTFNNTENGNPDRPVVADPDYTEINQAFISYAFDDNNKATVGRQRINHSGQRFLGGVAWRQNEQTYDAARLQLTPIDKLTIDYSYIRKANRIFGPEGLDAEFEGDSHAAISTYKITDGHTLSAFAYLLDLEEAPVLSSNTYGLEYVGSFKLSDDFSLGVNLSLAEQSDANDNPLNYDAGYYFGELAARFKPLTIAIGHEVLESDDGVSFKTPLATLHKFQGFADKFLATPPNGIEDSYIKLVTKLGGVKLVAFYHDFEANEGSMDYGSEIDFVASYAFNKNYSVLFKYAAYDADEFSTDTDKVWLMLTAAF